MQYERSSTEIYLVRYLAKVPFNAPVVASALLCIVLLLLVAGYYLIANLRHKDASPG